ncbi:MAG: hypothetical protein J6A15_08000 [Clostridia bacterium]|nr:hypothetical protein [Clostridia bacterium]
MIKIKIKDYKKFDYSPNPTTFEIILKNKREKIRGSLKVDFRDRNIEVDLPRRLSYYERLAVLKEIFYRFCLTKTKNTGIVVYRAVEEFEFIDKNSNEDFDTIIAELFSYGKVNFNAYKKKERVIANLCVSSNLILEAKNMGSSYVELQPMFDMTAKEIQVYKDMLIRYLDSLGVEIRLIEKTDPEQFVNPYYYVYTPYKMFACQICITGNTRGIE